MTAPCLHTPHPTPPRRLPPTQYESAFTGRALLSSLPVDRQPLPPGSRDVDPSLSMTRGPPVVKPTIPLAAQAREAAAAAGVDRRPRTDSMGVVQPKARAPPLPQQLLQLTDGGGGGGAQASATHGAAAAHNPYAHLKDVGLSPAPAAQALARQRRASVGGGDASSSAAAAAAAAAAGESLPVGALSYSLQDNAVGKGDACPRGPASHRGGAGLITGVVAVHRDAMVPAALVVAKWARLVRTDYGVGLGQPVRFSLEMQPLFYESLMLDLGAVTAGCGGYEFAPSVEPAVFMVDIGSVNRKVHGAVPVAAGAGSEGGGGSETPGSGRLLLQDAAATAAGGALRTAPLSAPRETKSRQRRREVEALRRLELRAVVAEGTQRAEEYLRGLARTGDDKALAALLAGGYAVSYTPHPWYKRVDVDGAARDRNRRRQQQQSRAVSAAAAAGGRGRRGGSLGPPPSSAPGTALVAFRGSSSSPPPPTSSGGDAGDELPLGRLGTASALTTHSHRVRRQSMSPPPLPPTAASQRPGTTTVELRGLLQDDGDAAGPDSRAGLPQETLFVMPGLDAGDSNGHTPLMLAARGGWLECVKLLLGAGADHRRRDARGLSAYDLARMESELAGVALAADHPGAGLRKRRAALTAALLDDRSLLECAQKGDMRRLRHLVEGERHAVNSCNAYGMTALHFAVLKRDVPMAAYLVQAGADAHARNNLGQTPTSLVMDAVGEGAGTQDALLEALASGPLLEARRAREAAQAAEVLGAQRRANAGLARKLREFTKGTTAARAVQLAMPPGGAPPDFSLVVGGRNGPLRAPAGSGGSAAAGGSAAVTRRRPTSADGGGGGRSTNAPAAAAPSLSRAQVSQLEAYTGALHESWNRHALDYMSLQQKQLQERDAREAAARARSSSAVGAEQRRSQAAGKRFTAADGAAAAARAAVAVAGGDSGGIDVRIGPDGTPLADGVISAGSAMAVWGTNGVRAARTSARRASEPIVRVAAGLADPAALTAALKSHAPAPAATDRKFDTYMRMRFGAGAARL